MFTKKIPIFYLIGILLLSCIISFLLIQHNLNAGQHADATNLKKDCDPYIVRLQGYKYVNQLLYVENECESDIYSGLKEQIHNYIESEKNAGKLTNASVYIRVYNTHGEWICVNPNEEYHASSLLKLPILFTFARMAESNPSLLDQKVFFTKHDASLPQQTYTTKTLQPGHSYTIRDLLQYLIAYSDNDALLLLYNYHNPAVYKKIFTDLNLPYSDGESQAPLGMKVKDYSVLLRVLYNGTYLSATSSEYALSLLTQSDFKDGVLKGIPDNITVAHKFGEFFTPNECQLHESALVYAPKHNYIITVMTKGKDMKQLSEIIGDISKLAYSSIALQ